MLGNCFSNAACASLPNLLSASLAQVNDAEPLDVIAQAQLLRRSSRGREKKCFGFFPWHRRIILRMHQLQLESRTFPCRCQDRLAIERHPNDAYAGTLRIDLLAISAKRVSLCQVSHILRLNHV